MSDNFPLQSLWQRKINHNIKKNNNKTTVCKLLWKPKIDRNEKVTTDLVCAWVIGTEVQNIRNTRGVIMVAHAYSTGLHCTM